MRFANTAGGRLIVGIDNPKVTEAFKQMDLHESWGTGLKRIRESCEELGIQEPELQEIGDMLRVNLFRPPVLASQAQKRMPASEFAQNTDRAIIALLEENSHFSRKELAKEIGVSESSVYRRLAALRKAGAIKYQGKTSDGYWVVLR
ncbi:MAG: winged helix-turn-helix transcriptional regulator [Actinomycetia bacterium]|nr:winged helix-turn-helix transcriptional regulator [Actinomycetes bacterium]